MISKCIVCFFQDVVEGGSFFDDLSHRARYLESILKEELDLFKDKLVQLEDRSGFLIHQQILN